MAFTCFGEILWDIFPDRRHLGGAPLNVAYYLNQLGNDSLLISAIGEDKLGFEALEAISAAGIATDSIIRIPNKETGQVLVSLDQAGCASYEFKADAAWDYIEPPIGEIKPGENHTLVFGSLAGRSAHNLQTLNTLLSGYKHRVFDLNLRPPFDDLDLCLRLMRAAELVKVNDDELALLCEHLAISETDLPGQLRAVLDHCQSDSICVTRGSDGAALLHHNEFYSHAGYPVEVVDTVGAGDAFLAGLISELASSGDAARALTVACAVGSIVAGQAGAQSPISVQRIDELISHLGPTAA
ncbi:MAG: carbohydrate kinase [Gammaproteobacteria bacterium]|nr:carbohydrate kinase [Gammaproteobacteria bacterium]